MREWAERIGGLAGLPDAAALRPSLGPGRCPRPVETLDAAYPALRPAAVAGLGARWNARYAVRVGGPAWPLPPLHYEGAAVLYRLPPPGG